MDVYGCRSRGSRDCLIFLSAAFLTGAVFSWLPRGGADGRLRLPPHMFAPPCRQAAYRAAGHILFLLSQLFCARFSRDIAGASVTAINSRVGLRNAVRSLARGRMNDSRASIAQQLHTVTVPVIGVQKNQDQLHTGERSAV